MPNMYEVYFTKKSEKELNKIAEHDRVNLLNKISELAFPFPKSFDIAKISGVQNFYRLRSGKTRTIFEVDQTKKEIWIRKVGYRGQIYKR